MKREIRFLVSITPELNEILEEVAKKREIPKSKLVETIIIEWAYRNNYNKFLHVNYRNKTISIWDYLLDRIIDLTYQEKDKTLFCEYCQTTNCGHILIASRLPEIKQKIKKGELVLNVD